MNQDFIRSRSFRWSTLLFIVLLLVPFFTGRFNVYILAVIFVTALLAMSLNLLVGHGGLYQFHHAVFYGVGAYTAGLLLSKTAVPAWVAFAAGPLAAAATGLVIGLICVRLNKLYFGMLQNELWRAIRLVVDTGFHSKGWTREQVIAYMQENSAVSETDAVAEAERYMAIPGQALAYKIGQLKITELRARAERELGKKFEIKAFHDEVLKDGAVPLEVLEAKIDRWIAANKD